MKSDTDDDEEAHQWRGSERNGILSEMNGGGGRWWRRWAKTRFVDELYDYALGIKGPEIVATMLVLELMKEACSYTFFHTVIFNKVFLGKKYNPFYEFV